MAVHPHRAAWSDERLDDLNHSIREGFARNDREHQEFREEMRAMRAEMASFRSEMNDRFDSMQRTFDSFQRMIIVGLFGLFASTLGAIVALAGGI